MKKIQITEKRLQMLINEEAQRQMRIMELTAKKKEILKQLNEMYAQSGEIDEINFDMIKQKAKEFIGGGSREQWKQRYLAWMQDNQRKHPDANIQIPQGADLEAAIDAAMKWGEFRVVRKNGQWVPTHHVTSTVGNAFDGSGTAE